MWGCVGSVGIWQSSGNGIFFLAEGQQGGQWARELLSKVEHSETK